MTLQKLLEAEGITLHDAVLYEQNLDYRKRTLTLELDVCLGGTSQVKEQWEAYQRSTLTIQGIRYVVQEPSEDPIFSDRPSTIDDFITRAEDIEKNKLPAISADVFRHSLFIFDDNSFIHFAGTSAAMGRWGEITDGPSR